MWRILSSRLTLLLLFPLLHSFVTSLAVPSSTNLLSPSGSFELQARHNHNFRLHLPTALLQICQKYNITVPDDVAQAWSTSSHHRRRHQPRAEHQQEQVDVAATPHHGGSEFLCPVDIGTPPQRFHLNFDTGSSDLWVYGARMPADQMHGQTLYRPGDSASAERMDGETWFAGYIDGGYVGGDVYRDRVAVGSLAVEGQGVQVAEVAHRGITEDGALEGIFGLGFVKLNFARPTRLVTWFGNVLGRLREPVFSVDLRHRDESKYTFGYVDTSKLAGPVVYTPVDTRAGYWTWTSSGYAIGNSSDANSRVSLCSRKLTGTLDTGTPVIILPACVVREYYAQVEGARYDSGQGGWVFACGVGLPDFTFGVGDGNQGETITVPGAYLNAGPADDDGDEDDSDGRRSGRRSTGEEVCLGGIQSLGKYVVFGAPAVKAGVVVFDAREGSERLGWANKTLAV